MLVSTKELIDAAMKNNAGVGAFNVTGLEVLQAIIAAAEEENTGVIIEFATVHEERGIVSLEEMGPIMMQYAKRAKVPVATHLDHGVEIDYVKKALDIGFTSVMYDGSALPYDENIANTKKVVVMAKPYGAMVEGEIGKMAGYTLTNDKELEIRDIERENFTNPDQAKDFVEKTGVDMLACSFGNSHGFYTAPPKLDFALLKEISDKTQIPIVMHGSSGVNDEDYAKVIDGGVRKINYYAYMAKEGGSAIIDAIQKEPDKAWQLHQLGVIARDAMKEHVRHAIQLFRNEK